MANMTKVYLMNTLLEKDYVHTMYFADEAAQRAYFQKRILSAMTFTDFSYQRKDQVIRIPKHIDSLYAAKVNYCMYQNTEYSNKWFYAFITDMKYIDDGRTDVYIKTDCMQTWMFDITVKHSFVEREHAKTDSAGANLIDEGLEIGQYICNKHTKANYSNQNYVVVGYTESPSGIAATPGHFTGIWSGLEYSAFDATDNTSDGEMGQLRDFIKAFNAGKIEALQIMFMAPQRIVQRVTNGPEVNYSNKPHQLYINEINVPEAGFGEVIESTTLNFTTGKIDGYTPRNKKLLSFPFRYLLATNNNGVSVVYKYELFYQKTDSALAYINPKFLIEGVLVPGCSIRLTPLDYNGATRNDEEGINMGKYPTLNWTSDAYTNWLTQNAVNIGLQAAAGVGQIVAGAAMSIGTAGIGAAVGVTQIVGGVSTIAGTLAQVHQQSFTPDQSKGNLNAGDVITASGQNDFHFYDMTIKEQYAKLIDEYFDMFGYKCHRVKIPEKNHRQSYWYTKTIDANIIGGIPQDDLQTIKDCYNRGITFWKNEEYYRNYSAPNAIV